MFASLFAARINRVGPETSRVAEPPLKRTHAAAFPASRGGDTASAPAGGRHPTDHTRLAERLSWRPPSIAIASSARPIAARYPSGDELISYEGEMMLIAANVDPKYMQRCANAGQRLIWFNEHVGYPATQLSFKSCAAWALWLCRSKTCCGATAGNLVSQVRKLINFPTASTDGRAPVIFTGPLPGGPEEAALFGFLRRLRKLYPSDKAPRRPVTDRLLRLIVRAMRAEIARLMEAGMTRKAVELSLWELGICLAQLCLLRTSELLKLRVCDVHFADDGKSAELELHGTKNASKGEVFRVAVTSSRYDVLKPLRAWCERRLAEEGPKAFLFAALGADADAAGATMASTLRSWLARAKAVPEKELDCYVWHSLRHGGCTDLLDSGVPLDVVMMHGRWKSSAWLSYRHWTDRTRRFLEAARTPALVPDAVAAAAAVLPLPPDPPPPAAGARAGTRAYSRSHS